MTLQDLLLAEVPVGYENRLPARSIWAMYPKEWNYHVVGNALKALTVSGVISCIIVIDRSGSRLSFYREETGS